MSHSGRKAAVRSEVGVQGLQQRLTVAINKNKINDNALKYIQKGQIKKAIKEYEKILAEDPGDVRTLLKKGDLLVRVGDRNQAVETYLVVANAYSQQGFHLKAVAVFKQILKIDDARIDVNLRLAEEYQNLGIIGDAMSHLQLVAAYYDQQGMVRESLDILRRIVELDPDNIASRIKLAELFSREEMITEAVDEFRRAAEELKNSNRIEDFIKVAERLIYHDPSDSQRIKELANIYLQRGDTKRALGKLQICFKSDPHDLETLGMLAMAFQELGQLSKTVSVHKEMAKIYQDQGAISEMQEVYRRILEIAPDDPEANQALGAGGQPQYTEAPVEIADSSAPQVTMPTSPQFEPEGATEVNYEPDMAEPMTMETMAPRAQVVEEPTAAAPAPQAVSAGASEKDREYISRLLTETDVYIKYGLHNKAYEHLNKIFEQDPNNIEAHGKLKDLYLAAGQNNHACQELVTLVHLASRLGQVEQARAHLQEMLTLDPGHPDGPGLEAMLAQQSPVGAPLAAGDDFIALEPGGADVMVSDPDGTVEVGDAMDSVEVSLDFDESSEVSVETGAFTADDQFTAPAVQAPPAEPDVFSFDSAGDDIIMLDETRDASLDEIPGIEAAEELLAAVKDGSDFDLEDDDDDDEEAPTRIADLSDLHVQSLDADAVPVQAVELDSLDDYGVGEETMEVGQMETGVYPPGGPADELGLPEVVESPDEFALDSGDILTDSDEPILLDDEGAADDVIVLDDEGLDEFGFDAQEPIADDLPLLEDAAAFEPVSPDDLTLEPDVSQDPPSQPPGADPELIDFDAEDDFFGSQQPPVADLSEQDAAPAESEDFDAEEAPTQLKMEMPADLIEAAAALEPTDQDAEPVEEDDSELEDGLEEVDFFIQQNLVDEAADALKTLKESFPEHPEVLAMAQKLERLVKGEAPVAQVTPEDLGDSFDLAAEIEREVGDEAASPIDDEFQYSVDDVFSEFKKGVEKVVEKEDSATHFDLGIAYKEMGLIDDAISEFSVASQDGNKAVESLTMIGLCMVEKGQYSEAINRFKDALHSPGIGDQESTGLYFEMGNVYEKLEDLTEALFYFKKVYKRDNKFRDVTTRLKALVKVVGGKKGDDSGKASSQEGGNKAGAKSSSKDKISYM